MPDEPAPPDVVVGVITSSRGALLGRRADGVPPWVFPGGKVEPGESPGDAVVREVREETGLEVAVSGEIGRRVHPATQRTIIYLACRPISDLNVSVRADELTAVIWAPLDDVQRLLADIYAPVLRHLRHELNTTR
jgi:8-oxo-dGTP pyrophosphatase MutT (NUDIX family)